MQNPSEKGKSKTLLAAYEKASEANGLDHFKMMLVEHQKALQEDIAMQEERAAKKAEKAKKAAARKSTEAAIEDEDDMDIDDDVGAEKPRSKKRKKTADDSDADEKVGHPSKTPESGANGTSHRRRQKRLRNSSFLLRNNQPNRHPRRSQLNQRRRLRKPGATKTQALPKLRRSLYPRQR